MCRSRRPASARFVVDIAAGELAAISGGLVAINTYSPPRFWYGSWMPLGPGSHIDRYVLVKHLGGGGQADVWQATDPLHPDRPRAIKLVSTRVAKGATLERLQREARLLAELRHPSVCRVPTLRDRYATKTPNDIDDKMIAAAVPGAIRMNGIRTNNPMGTPKTSAAARHPSKGRPTSDAGEAAGDGG